MTVRIIIGDVRERLKDLPPDSVDCCVTSPPYYGLRDYGVSGQIGLEETPDAYIAELVGVFREVRRVLKPTGTLWLNLGDSYNAHPGQRKTTDKVGAKQETNAGSNTIGSRYVEGLKAKDLLMIPARVALALQQPYYTGRIKNEHDRIWLAAMVEAEGCMFIHRRKAGQHNGQGYYRTNDSYGVGMEVANTSEAIVRRCMEITGQGSICSQSPDQNNKRKQTIFRWNMRSNECRDIIREIYPYMIAKRQQARLMLGCPSAGEKAEAAHQALIGLHRGSPTDVDFAEPESMHEKGWWVRSEIIWSKLNPMPESVTDRPTSAHEKIYLLAKSERYYFDAESVAEPAIYAGDERHLRPDNTHAAREKKQDQTGNRTYTGFNERYFGSRLTTGKPQADTRNIRNVWTIATQPYSEAHFATFPPALIEPCIKAGCPKGGTVLDPFGGAGTTGLVADRLERSAILVELNPEYAAMAEKRIRGDAPLFAEVAA